VRGLYGAGFSGAIDFVAADRRLRFLKFLKSMQAALAVAANAPSNQIAPDNLSVGLTVGGIRSTGNDRTARCVRAKGQLE
jgi:hypothetical protein